MPTQRRGAEPALTTVAARSRLSGRPMMRKLGVLLGAGALLVGCTSSPPPGPARLSPPIPGDPLDLTASRDKPCDLLPPERLARFYITHPGTVTPGPACAWTPSDTAKLTYHASVDTTGGGLEGVYRRRAGFPVFEPLPVHGFPAVHVENAPGRCHLMVGVADTEVLDVVVDDQGAFADTCGEADTFANVVIGYQGGRAP